MSSEGETEYKAKVRLEARLGEHLNFSPGGWLKIVSTWRDSNPGLVGQRRESCHCATPFLGFLGKGCAAPFFKRKARVLIRKTARRTNLQHKSGVGALSYVITWGCEVKDVICFRNKRVHFFF